jgi:predicted ATP-grasp superfamily ATP-dependent carboligase
MEKPLLILALSGRALAAAARRARDPAFVIDGFADLDTAQAALACRRVPLTADGLLGGGLAPEPLLAAVARWRRRAGGIVYGAGFEHAPALLAALAKLLPLIGNGPELVARVKDPMGFAALLATLSLPHPETRLDAPAGGDWLRKRVGAAGGAHVARAAKDTRRRGFYYQRRVEGRPVSALFLADGRDARVIGFSAQWPDGCAAAPFRYGGCAGPLRLPRAVAGAIGDACTALTAATGLRGLNSLDLMLDGARFQILEINPRPGAALDLFGGARGMALWRLHREAVEGRLPPKDRRPRGIRAASVLYAPAALALPDPFAWPSWSADRGRPGSTIASGAPICTVRASGASVAAARQLAARRAATLLARLIPAA